MPLPTLPSLCPPSRFSSPVDPANIGFFQADKNKIHTNRFSAAEARRALTSLIIQLSREVLFCNTIWQEPILKLVTTQNARQRSQ